MADEGDAEDAGGSPSESPSEAGAPEETVEEAAARAIRDLEAAEESAEEAAASAIEGLEDGSEATKLEGGDFPDEHAPTPFQGSTEDPPDDVEMPLTEHIREMLSRLTIVLVLGGIATLIAFPFASDLVTTMWYDVHPGDVATCVPDPQAPDCTAPHVYTPLEPLLTEIRVAALAGIVVAFPALVYETYQFMRPGLYPNERRYYLAAVPTSLVLALVGMAFAYFILLPILFNFFLFYSEGSAEIAFALRETFDILLLMMGVLAIIFQIPLFIMLAIMMGVTTRQWLESKRIYFWLSFAGIAFVFSPDPTGMAPVLVGATMVALFEGTLLLLRWTGR